MINFRVMVIKSRNGNDVFETSRYQEERNEDIEFVIEGIPLMSEGYRNNDITIDNDLLFIGNQIVHEGGEPFNIQSIGGRVPSLYVIRTFNGKYWEFECGFDLLDENVLGNLYWAKGRTFKNIGDCFDFLELNYGEFRIFIEEPIRIDEI